MKRHKHRLIHKVICCGAAIGLVVMPGLDLYAANTVLDLPEPGRMVTLSDHCIPTSIRGVKLYKDNPLKFDFIINADDRNTDEFAFELEIDRLIKYFLTAITVPHEDLWVNLSPFENDRIIPSAFGYTEMGRDLLAQDYLLKQMTASLMYPEKELGEEFWSKIYDRAYQKFGTTKGLMDTFNKVWVIPDYAEVYVENDVALLVDCRLKVLTEQEYHQTQGDKPSHVKSLDPLNDPAPPPDNKRVLTTEVLRDFLIPEIEREVNANENFAKLRQIYHSLILATWMKRNLRNNILSKVYMGRNKIGGVEVTDKEIKNKIYDQYVTAFQKGVYDYVKEDYDPVSQTLIPRRYFSGGAGFENIDEALVVTNDPARKRVAADKLQNVLVARSDLAVADSDNAMVMTRRNFIKSVAMGALGTGISSPALAAALEKVAAMDAADDRRAVRDNYTKLFDSVQLDDIVPSVYPDETQAIREFKRRFARQSFNQKPDTVTPEAIQPNAKLKVAAAYFGISRSQDIEAPGFFGCIGSVWFHPATQTIAVGHHYENTPNPESDVDEIMQAFIERGIPLNELEVTLVGGADTNTGHLAYRLFQYLQNSSVRVNEEGFHLFDEGKNKTYYVRQGTGSIEQVIAPDAAQQQAVESRTRAAHEDHAMLVEREKNRTEPTPVGGIDFNPDQINFFSNETLIEVETPDIDPRLFQTPNFQGFTPVIIEIVPVHNLPVFLGLVNPPPSKAISANF